MVYTTLAVVSMPAAATVSAHLWLRRRVPLPRVNPLVKEDIVGIVVFLILWVMGIARVRYVDDPVSMVLGLSSVAIFTVAAMFFLVKVIWPTMRNRDQRRLDRELDDEGDEDISSQSN